MTDDPCELIAEAMVAAINTAQSPVADSPFAPLLFQAVIPEDITAEVERENITFKVMLSPFGEVEEKTGRGGQCVVEHAVTLAVISQLDSEYPRRKLNSLVYSIRKYLRGRQMQGYSYSRGETMTKNDPTQLPRKFYVNISRIYYTGTESA